MRTMSLTTFAKFSCIVALISTALGEPGIPIPLHPREQAAMIVKHNDLRKEVANQMNLQCMLIFEQALIDRAQKQAERCEPKLPVMDEEYGFAMMVSEGPNKTMLEEYVRAARDGHDNFHYDNNTCDASKENCDIFRQVYWYEAHAIGCGRATCGERTHFVCAYSYKQNEESNPFIRWEKKENVSCSLCSSEKPECDDLLGCCTLRVGVDPKKTPYPIPNPGPSYNQGVTEPITPRPAEPTTPEPKVEPTPSPTEPSAPRPPEPTTPAPTVPTPPQGRYEKPAKLTTLELWWDGNEQKYLMVSSEGAKNEMRNDKKRYAKINDMGKVASAQTAECTELRAIYWMYQRSPGMNLYVIDNGRYHSLIRQGFQDKGIIGYAVEQEALCSANHKVVEYQHSGNGRYVQVDESQNTQALQSNGYVYRNVSFYIWRS